MFSGIGKMFGAVGDVLGSPFKLLSGDIGGAVGGLLGAPFKLLGGAAETAIGAVTMPFQMLGGLFGMGASPSAMSGAQAGFAGHLPPGY